MKIRRYLGNNAQEAILKVKMDLGNDAVILNTRKVRQKGLFKIFSKPMVEVLAAIDDDYRSKREAEPQRQGAGAQATVREPELKPMQEEKDEKIAELESKVSNMESLLQKIYEQIQPNPQRAGAPVPEEKPRAYPRMLQIFYNNLVKNEVEVEIARKVTDTVLERVGENASVNEVASVMYNVISGMLGKPEPLRLREDGKPTVVMLVGPTGVGKTTTLAKIAANYALNNQKKVGLITADTYRIAAVEQLRTYAEILGMELTVIYSPGEVGEAIKLHSDKDIVFIDTAGRSHKNKAQFDELKALVLSANADEVYLLLSTTTSIRNCREILSHYGFIKNYKLLFTKLDETPITGIILNTRYLTNKSLSYVTTGQSVPDDIEVANIDKITKNLLGSIT